MSPTNRKNILTLVEQTLIPHDDFAEGMARLEECFLDSMECEIASCLAVLGESRTGKSFLLTGFRKRYPRRRLPEGREIPILWVRVPSRPSPNSLCEVMLSKMGDKRFDKGRETDKTTRLHTLLRECKTKMIMIDEFQQIVDRGTDRVMFDVADWLKALLDDANVSLVTAGLPNSAAVWNQNEQLRGRFMAPVAMNRFDWDSEVDIAKFMGILQSFHESLSEHFEVVDFTSPEMVYRFYAATGGLIGYLSKILSRAVMRVHRRNETHIRMSDLAEAHRVEVWVHNYGDEISEPFNMGRLLPENGHIVELVKELGTRDEPNPRPRTRSRVGGLKTKSANQE